MRDGLAVRGGGRRAAAALGTVAAMRHVALTIRAGDLDEVLDRLLPIVPQGVHPPPAGDERLELAVYGDAPGRAELEAAAGARAAVDARRPRPTTIPSERRLQAHGRRPPIGGRVVVRPEGAPAAGPGLLDVVHRRRPAARSARARTRRPSCASSSLLGLEPGGAVRRPRLRHRRARDRRRPSWAGAPLIAVDHEPVALDAADANARRNGVEVEAMQADLPAIPPPPAPTLAANVPLKVHADDRRAAGARDARACSSPGSSTSTSPGVVEAYEPRGPAARRAGGRAAAGRRRCWCARELRRSTPPPRTPRAPPTASSRAAIADGIALSAHKLVEEGARALLLILPGVRADRRAAAGGRPAGHAARRSAATELGWEVDPSAVTDYGKTAAGDRAAGARRASGSAFWTEPRRSPGGCWWATRATTGTGRRHFVGHAVMQQVRADR